MEMKKSHKLSIMKMKKSAKYSDFLDVEVKLVLGHRAVQKDKVTPEGFSHDWTVFVRGEEGNNIQHFVEKVVFYLHESFPKPKRVVKEPPFSVTEAGYAGFIIPIDVYFKTQEEPKKVNFVYDLYLRVDGTPASYKRIEKLTFKNPSDDFRCMLIKAGGDSGHSSQIKYKVAPNNSSISLNKEGKPIAKESQKSKASHHSSKESRHPPKGSHHSSKYKDTHPPKDTPSSKEAYPPKESHPPKYSYLPKDSHPPKVSHLPKNLHPFKDSHHKLKDSQHQPKDSNHQTKDSHNQLKDSNHQTKDSHNQLKDSHSSKEVQHVSKETHRPVKEHHSEEGHKTKDSHHLSKDGKSSKDTRSPEPKDPKPPKLIKLDKELNKSSSAKRAAPSDSHSSHGNVEKKKKPSPVSAESSEKSSSQSKHKVKEGKSKAGKHKNKPSGSSSSKKEEIKPKHKSSPAPPPPVPPELEELPKPKLSSPPFQASSPLINVSSTVVKTPPPILKPLSPVIKPSPDSTGMNSDSDESQKSFCNKSPYNSPASSISESSLHALMFVHSILSPLSDEDDSSPSLYKRKLGSECDMEYGSPEFKPLENKPMPKLKKKHHSSEPHNSVKPKHSENYHEGNNSINNDISIHHSPSFDHQNDFINNTAYREELLEMQRILNASEDPRLLQKIVDVIGKTGNYEITTTTFEFDLWSLDPAVVQEIKVFL